MINSKSDKSNTGYKGIWFKKSRGVFIAQITYRSKKGVSIALHIGQYEKLQEAVTAREEFIKSLF